ncbi:putative basic amino acid antiporter YfcC [Natronincola ferrireducens]|uniref:Uncharacterized membrane protein YfcC, ion transporter superfamily n=1 Tax=Natronincola ferrireducens TaxID=393762 RepID=A0A1G8ZXR4_9FIRM|nr:putative basic amino acid antiporter YfcC [Natronincola ferrireducens]SDK19888.1 Uncharacterized membrane protein YfcC, ion transporter superfamily [Natronincola ferrireducens]
MSTEVKDVKAKKRSWDMPDSYVIIFFVVVLAALLTYVIPLGQFDVLYRAYDPEGNVVAEVIDGEVVEFTVNNAAYRIDASGDRTEIYKAGEEDSIGNIRKNRARAVEVTEGETVQFTALQEYGEYISSGEKQGIKLFEKWGGVGFLNYAFEGMVKGDKWGSAVGVVAFILIVGGAFGIILKTGAVEAGILNMIKRTKGTEVLIIPILFFLFALGGAVFGMGEEAIPFAMIIVPLVIAMGYDAIVGIMITYVATQIGFATSWMNPFSVAIAQGVAGVPVLSGAGFRIFMFIIFTAAGIAFTWIYAMKIKKDPTKSVAYESDAYYRNDFKQKDLEEVKFTTGHGLVLLTILLGIIWVIWGVNQYEYYIPEIAAIFFTMGLVSGIIGVLFKLNNMGVNDIADGFRDGAKDLVGAAMIVGMAQGIVLVLGDSSPTTDTVLNTILHGMANVLGGLSTAVTAWLMFIFQSVFNFFVVSGSGQAAITMPLMAPLAQILGVSKQIAVLAFQLGDGLTNLIVPTSGCLMGVLGVARLDWVKWAKFQIKFQGMLFLLASIFMIAAVVMGLN